MSRPAERWIKAYALDEEHTHTTCVAILGGDPVVVDRDTLTRLLIEAGYEPDATVQDSEVTSW